MAATPPGKTNRAPKLEPSEWLLSSAQLVVTVTPAQPTDYLCTHCAGRILQCPICLGDCKYRLVAVLFGLLEPAGQVAGGRSEVCLWQGTAVSVRLAGCILGVRQGLPMTRPAAFLVVIVSIINEPSRRVVAPVHPGNPGYWAFNRRLLHAGKLV